MREGGEWLEQSITGLSDEFRDVIALRFYKGLQYREIAEALDIPIGTVKSRLHHALNKLNVSWHKTHRKAA